MLALQRENKEVLWGSMVKETMKRKKPSFNETYYGFRTFSHLLEDAQRRGIVALRRDQRSGSYIVEDLGPAANAPQVVAAATSSPTSAVVAAPAIPALAGSAAPPVEAEGANGQRTSSRRRRGGRGRRRGAPTPLAPGAYPDPTPGSGHPDEPETDDTHDGEDEGEEYAADDVRGRRGPTLTSLPRRHRRLQRRHRRPTLLTRASVRDFPSSAGCAGTPKRRSRSRGR